MKYTLSVLVENHAGVLSKVSGLFSRRGFNIDSLAVGTTEDENISRITIVVNGDEYVVEQLEKQLNKLIPVIKVRTYTEGGFISRGLYLVKVHCPAKQRLDIMKIAELMDAKIVDVSVNTMTLQFADTQERFETLKIGCTVFLINFKCGRINGIKGIHPHAALKTVACLLTEGPHS